MNNKIIETRDLILRKAVKEDAEDLYYNYWSQEISCKYMFWKTTKSLDEANERILKTIKFQQKYPVSFVVYDKNSKEVIGLVGFDEKEKNVYQDCGLGIGPRFTGKGYGKQLLEALIKYLFIEVGATKIICNCDRKNIASSNWLKSCGLEYTHSEKGLRERDNVECTIDYYEIKKGVCVSK